MMQDSSTFPDDDYRETVLAPLFDGVKTHYASHMAAINQAHLMMLDERGILSEDVVVKIAHCLNDIEQDIDPSQQQYTGEHEDYFFLVESELRTRLGDDLGGMLHTARSRNDMDHTVFKMALREHCDSLVSQSLQLAQTILSKIEAEKATPVVAYTHGQPAQATTFGHYLAAALEVLISDIHRITSAQEKLDLCPMGAAAITTTGFPIDRYQVSTFLGFKEPKRNSYGCIASVDYVTGLYSAIKLLFLHLGRLIQDFAFWTSFEVGQLYVPNSLVQISSIMPQKRNPVPIEHLRHLSSMTCFRCDSIVNTMHNTPFTDMNDSEGEVQSAGYSAFESGGRVLKLLTSLIQQVSINPERVKRNADNACVTITELADTLVREENLSFRHAHSVVGNVARSVVEESTSLEAAYEIFVTAFVDAVGRPTQLSVTAFIDAVSLERFINVRDRFGGPADSAISSALNHYREQLESLNAVAEENVFRRVDADRFRAKSFKALLET